MSKFKFLVILCLFLLLMVVTTAADPLQELITEKEQIVVKLAEATKEAFAKRCTLNCSNCVNSACGSLLSQNNGFESVCLREFGDIKLNHTCQYECKFRQIQLTGSILTVSDKESESTNMEKCWTKELEPTFKRNYDDDVKRNGNLKWQYIGTPSGLVRIFPYYTQRNCYDFDPRLRPWYVSATSGPKAIILVLDVSASMLNYDRLKLAIEAAKTVVLTLSYVDNIAIVLFGDQAKELQPPGHFGGLLRANSSNKAALLETIDRDLQKVDPSRGTSFEAGFEKAFDILDEANLECNSAILFLTDGHPNKGQTSQFRLTDLVRERNKYGTIIFTFSLGSTTGASLLQGIACQSQGVYSHIEDGGNLVQQLAHYYEYFSQLRVQGNETVSWVEPYDDAAGAGLVVTVSKAVYVYDTTNTSHLIGVVGADILVDDLRQAAKEANLNHEEFIQRLASNNKCPTVKTNSDCLLSRVRSKGGATHCGGPSHQCLVKALHDCNTRNLIVDYCDYEPDRFFKSSKDYFMQSCCINESTVTCTTNKAFSVKINFTAIIAILHTLLIDLII